MKLIIYGNGRIAKVLYQFVKKKISVCCFTVDKKFINESTFEGLPLIAFEEIDSHYPPTNHSMLIGVGYHKMNSVRNSKFEQAKIKGYQISNFIHDSVVIHDTLKIGEGNVILDHASIHPDVIIGNNNFIWSNATVAHGCTVENDCWITSGTTIAGDTIVKSGCFLGVNSTVGHNIVVASETFVGANCLISKNTEPKSVYISKDSAKFFLDSDRFLKFSGV
jgi:sugar O-acyltransferase (sialic acid O-acetyltransferase NeuD family)